MFFPVAETRLIGDLSLNKSHKAQCFINKPHKPARRWLSWIAHYSEPQEDLDAPIHVDLAPFPESINPDGSVVFGNSRDGRKEQSMKTKIVKPDLLIYATGYKQSFDWLGEGYPKGPDHVDTLEMVDSSDTSICWVGHVRPGVGAIPPIAEEQAMLWSLLLQDRVPVPKDEGTYRLLAKKTARIQVRKHSASYLRYISMLMFVRFFLSMEWITRHIRMRLPSPSAVLLPFHNFTGITVSRS
jgi:dimethylaniline monooxygenase (N-oxide forming)